MKQLIVVLSILVSNNLFSQGHTKSSIQWLNIEEAEQLTERYTNNMLVFFFRKGCPDCNRMKSETLRDPKIIKLINENFYPVALDARSKDTINFNGKEYINQQPIDHGRTFRHDLYHELVVGGNNQYVYPYIVIVDGKHRPIRYLPGYLPTVRLERSLIKLLNK